MPTVLSVNPEKKIIAFLISYVGKLDNLVPAKDNWVSPPPGVT